MIKSKIKTMWLFIIHNYLFFNACISFNILNFLGILTAKDLHLLISLNILSISGICSAGDNDFM